MPLLWFLLKNIIGVSDRYLPSISDVVSVYNIIHPSIFIHFLWSFVRLIFGFVGGVVIGICIGLLMYKYNKFNLAIYPSIQSLRSIPAAATVPFFLLWFGFEESGKIILIFLGIAFNLAIAVLEILEKIPEKYIIFFRSVGYTPKKFIKAFVLPFVLEKILPTLRFSLSLAIGLVVVSEFLGSQVGLGYLIQTARATFSMDVIFACMILFGIMNYMSDKFLVMVWKGIIYWKI